MVKKSKDRFSYRNTMIYNVLIVLIVAIVGLVVLFTGKVQVTSEDEAALAGEAIKFQAQQPQYTITIEEEEEEDTAQSFTPQPEVAVAVDPTDGEDDVIIAQLPAQRTSDGTDMFYLEGDGVSCECTIE